jgi:predicted SAM-dependent methyltransferase
VRSSSSTGKRRRFQVVAVALVVVPFVLLSWTEPVQQQQSAMIVAAYHGASEAIFSWRSRSAIRDYVRENSLRKLQIGAGTNRLDGWLNTDISPEEGLAYLDATGRFPLEDSSFHYVFSEHVIEHLGYKDGMNMLAESYRILAPGGRIRIATPNLLRLIALFQENKTDEMRDYLQGKLAWHGWPNYPAAECFILNLELSSFGHRFLYDPQTLKAALASSGFQSIHEFRPGDSDDPHLRGVEIRQRTNVEHLSEYETMIFQAMKPDQP